MARQIAIVAAEAAEEITEVSILGVLGSIAGGVASAAAMIGMTMAGNYLLRWIAKRHMDKTSDDNPFQGLVGYFIIKRVWYPMRIDIVEHKKWFFYFRDLTGFWRHYTVKAGDERVHILKPPRKWPYDHPALMYIHGKTVKVPFYPEFPVGTQIKRIFKGDWWAYVGSRDAVHGVIKRKMIIDNEGTNPDGTYDKYKIILDNGQQIYLPVYKFQVYAQNFKSKMMPHGRPVPVRPKSKHARKDDVMDAKKWRALHWESSQDKGQEVYTNESAIAKEIREDKKKMGFVTCPEHMKRRLTVVSGEQRDDTFGEGWSALTEWESLSGPVTIDRAEFSGVCKLHGALHQTETCAGPASVFDEVTRISSCIGIRSLPQGLPVAERRSETGVEFRLWRHTP